MHLANPTIVELLLAVTGSAKPDHDYLAAYALYLDPKLSEWEARDLVANLFGKAAA
jgi:hypothetical protein